MGAQVQLKCVASNRAQDRAMLCTARPVRAHESMLQMRLLEEVPPDVSSQAMAATTALRCWQVGLQELHTWNAWSRGVMRT